MKEIAGQSPIRRGGTTVTLAVSGVPVNPGMVTVMVTVPAAMPVTTPELLTLATLELEEVQLTSCVRSARTVGQGLVAPGIA